MKSLAIETQNGNQTIFVQPVWFYLYLFSVSGTTLTPIVTNQAESFVYSGDWLEWTGLNQVLQPNTKYAYVFKVNFGVSGYGNDQIKMSCIASNGLYPNGEVIETSGGLGNGATIIYGNPRGSTASFDVGLVTPTLPVPTVPTYTPNVTPLYADTAVILTEVSGGPPPMYYEWQTDNGTGGVTWSNVGGFSTNITLAVSAATTSGFNGNYEYQVIVSNSSGGVATSPALTLSFNGASAPIVNTDITPSPANYAYVGQPSVTFSASFVGTLPMTYQWYVDTGSGPAAVSSSGNPSATNTTLVLSNIQMTNAGTYTLYANNSQGGPSSSSGSILSCT